MNLEKIQRDAVKEMERISGKAIDPKQVQLDSVRSQYDTLNRLEKIQVQYTIERHRTDKPINYTEKKK